MDTVHWVKIALNTCITVFLVIILYVIQVYIKPFQSGFYCNDFTINMKYSESTVNNEVLVGISCISTFILVLFTEFINKTHVKLNRNFVFLPKNSTNYKLKLFNQRVVEIKEYIGNIYIIYGFFIIGHLLNTLVTLIGKKTIGRLRPNFLDVCRPDINPYSKCGEVFQTGKTYLIPDIDFMCTAQDKSEVEESRLSFPSGHSSTSFYTAVFLICYLNHMWKRRSCSLILHIVQVFIFSCAFFVAMTRITDNKHHVTDVFAGSGIGALVGLLTSYYSMQFYKRSEYMIKHNSKLFDGSYMGSRTREDSNNCEESEKLIDKIV